MILVVFFTAAVGLLADPVAASTEAELEAAEDDEEEVSFIFETGSDTESIDIDIVEDFGGVDFEYERIETMGGSLVSTETQGIDVDNDTTYRVYVTIQADEGITNDETATVEIDGDSGFSYTETLEATILEPEFSDDPDDQDVEVIFEPDDEGEAERFAFPEFENVGEGFMDIESVTATTTGTTGTYIDATVTDEPDTISGGTFGNTESATVLLSIEDTISEGIETVTVEAEDTLGNTQEVTISVDIRKPPAAGAPDHEIDLGDILVGESETTTFTLTERSGYDSIEGIETESFPPEIDGDISFPDLDQQSILQDGTGEQEVTVEVDDDAERGELNWNVRFTPEDPDGVSTETVSFSANIVYPPYYESVDLTPETREIVFDEPRDQRSEFTEEVDVAITNGGDLEMNIQDISASVDSPTVDGTVVDTPGVIPPGATGFVTVDVTADTDAPEETWELTFTSEANEPAPLPEEETGTATRSSAVSVEHETELDVEQTEIDVGSVIVTERESRTIDLSERLGYQDIEEFSIEQISGPEAGWLTVEAQPDELPAGSTEPFVPAVEFDTSAEVFNTYTWEFEVDGTNVDAETIVFEAEPEPLDFDSIITDLEGIENTATGDGEIVVSEMVSALETLEADLQSEETDADRDDIPILVTGARSSGLLVEATEETASLIADGEHEAAQTELVRAAAAFNTLSLTAEELSEPGLRSQAEIAAESGEQLLESLIDDQQAHFEQRLDDPETPMLETAQINRELARLAELAGNENEAAELRESAEASFEEYSDLIADANEELIEAREQRDELDEDLFFSPLDQRLFFIGSYTSYDEATDEILAGYESAVDQFEEAGATERAETAEAERTDLSGAYDTAFLLSVGLGGVFAVILLGVIVWEIRALYRYRVDSEAAISGDFLLPWAGEG